MKVVMDGTIVSRLADWHGSRAMDLYLLAQGTSNHNRQEEHLAGYLRHIRIHDQYRRLAFLLNRRRH